MAAIQIIKKMNFRLEIKLTVKSSWYRLSEPKINNVKSKWSKENEDMGKFRQLPSLMWEKFACLNKIQSVHHGCNPNDQENSHKLKIWTVFSKNRKTNFRLQIKLVMNSSWFWLCEPKINNLKSKWSRKLALVWAKSNNCLNWWGEKFAS